MSTNSRQVRGHHSNPSFDTTLKFNDAHLGRGGFVSAETVNPNNEYFAQYPNTWTRIRDIIREPAAEMLGTMILTLVGTAGNCQVVLSSNSGVASSQKGDYLSLVFGWACSVALGAWVAGGVSGGHINPVVTLCMAVFRGFPWRKVPGYVLGQIIGAWAGALLVFANYFHAIDIFEGQQGRRTLKTGSLFGTYALDYLPGANCFFDEFLGTFVLLLVVFAITDKRNGPPPAGLIPLVVFITILGIGVAFGMQTGFAINPARDLGPRMMTAMVGYGWQVFSYRGQYWLWSPLLGSVCGGLVASFIYDFFIYLGPESFINSPNASARHETVRVKTSAVPLGSNLEIGGNLGVQEL